jgi:protein O-mannosyl-transferase
MPILFEKKTIKILICLFLLVSTFTVYSQIQDHDFINFDDPLYVIENLKLKDGLTLESVIWAFTTSRDGNWFPITWISHLLDYQFFGLNPEGHHLTNLLLHIANALILFFVFVRITGTLWQSGFVAALFALHPFNIESVAWVSERKNVLSTFFWMLTLWTYTYYARKPVVKRYLLVALCFVLGLMSKPMLVTLPFVLLLLDYWPLERLKIANKNDTVPAKNQVTFYRLILEKLPLLFFSVGSCFATYIIQKSAGAVYSPDLLPLQTRIVNALVSYIKYLEMMVWPEKLAILYPHSMPALPIWKGLVCAVVLVIITIAVMQRVHRKPYLAVGWFWYLGTLVPVIGVVQVGVQAMADRYAYVPLIGIFIMVAWGIPELLAKWRQKEKVLIILVGLYIPTLMAVTWNQVSHWKNSITIFEHAIRVSDSKHPDFAVTHTLLGNALRSKGLTEEAISHYRTAIKLKPSYSMAYDNLGNALRSKGLTEEAISLHKTTIKLNPNYSGAYNNLGNALRSKGLTEEAISHYKTAIKLDPNYSGAYNNLGNALQSKGLTEEAISLYKTAIKLNPYIASAHYTLGIFLSKEGNTEEAISHYKTAIKLKPDHVGAHHNLGLDLYKERKIEEAIFYLKNAIRLKPDNAKAHNDLGNATLAKGKTREAISHYKTAIRIQPDYAYAYNNLGYTQFLEQKYEEAISNYRMTIKLKPNMTQTHKNLKNALHALEELEKQP